ncbi:MAG: DUF1080 domain-containing protein [Planctomycetaceae bacterium]|nr:DUF1080 domain-containing protein [Planctomycetaceae bacterium]
MMMLFFFILSLLVSGIVFFQSGELSAQILLDSSPGLIQRDSTSNLTNPATEKTTIRNVSPFNPLFNNQNKNEIGNLDSLNSPLSSPWGGSASGKTNITLGDFSVGSSSNIPLPSYGAYSYGHSSWFRPGMTREEYVLRQAEEAKLREYNREEQESRLRRQLEVEKGIRAGIYSLFDESQNYLPKVLVEDSKHSPHLSLPSIGNSAETSVPSTITSLPTDLPDSPKTLTPDELAEQELKAQRATVEALEDAGQRQRELEALQKREDERKRWLQQRAEAERGAKLFQLSPSLQLKDKMLKEGWCLLFDGQTFFGWRTQKDGPYGGGRFTIANGEIQSDPQHPGLLYTTNQLGDSTLRFEFQAEENAEAFLLLRTPPNPKDLHSSCYAIVLNSADFTRPRGTVLGRQQLATEQLQEQEKTRELTRQETVGRATRWHRLKAQFEVGRLHVTVDQHEPIALFDTKPLGYGYVGLLVTKGKVRFRNMYWLPGSSMPIFDPIDPEKHWRYRGDVVQLKATRDLAMQLSGGPGVIETKDFFNNFVLQLEYNITFSSARTGLFLRSIPREEQTGYEISIQNFPKRQDRDQMIGVDVGAFRGRKNARYIRPEDHIWNYLTVVAVDRHFQTWVNGISVCEMSDQNQPSKTTEKNASSPTQTNPFRSSGTIQLLAPQAGTDIQFRNIRIMPIRPRFEKPQTFDDLTKTTWEELSKARKERENEQKLDKKMISEKTK